MSYEEYLKEKYKYFEKQLKSGSPSAADSLGRISFLLEACDLMKKHDLECDENGVCIADISEHSNVFFAEIRFSTDIHENAISITFHLGAKYIAIPNCYFHGHEDGKEKTDEWLKNYIKIDWEMLIRSDCNILNAESFEKTYEKISDIMTFEKALLILTGHGYLICKGEFWTHSHGRIRRWCINPIIKTSSLNMSQLVNADYNNFNNFNKNFNKKNSLLNLFQI